MERKNQAAISLENLLAQAQDPTTKVAEDTNDITLPDFNNQEQVFEFYKTNFPGINPNAQEYFYGGLKAYELCIKRNMKEKKEWEEQQKIERVTKPWTKEEMKEQALKLGKRLAEIRDFKNGFIIDQHNEKAFELLCMFFSNDPEFEKHSFGGENYSLSKGIWLQSGERGSGKSVLLECFRFNKRACFHYRHSIELATMYQKGGYAALDPNIEPVQQASNASITFYQKYGGLMFDELYGEDKTNYMGTPLMISPYIINKLYDFSNNFKNKRWMFHCTSNADGEDIEKTVGKNYRSRMKDMFNLIKLDGPDRR